MEVLAIKIYIVIFVACVIMIDIVNTIFAYVSDGWNGSIWHCVWSVHAVSQGFPKCPHWLTCLDNGVCLHLLKLKTFLGETHFFVLVLFFVSLIGIAYSDGHTKCDIFIIELWRELYFSFYVGTGLMLTRLHCNISVLHAWYWVPNQAQKSHQSEMQLIKSQAGHL